MYNVSLSPTGLALPDFGLGSPTSYNAPPVTNGGEFAGFKDFIQTGVKTYGDIVSIVDSRNGATVAQPVTLPSPQTLAPVQTDPPEVGVFSGFAARMASKFGIAIGFVWAIIALTALLVVAGIMRFLKRR